MRDSCNTPLPINIDLIPQIRYYRCPLGASECVQQGCYTELNQEGAFDTFFVTYHVSIVGFPLGYHL